VIFVFVEMTEVVDLRAVTELAVTFLVATFLTEGEADGVVETDERTDAIDGGLLAAGGDGVLLSVVDIVVTGRLDFVDTVEVREPTEDLRVRTTGFAGVDNEDTPADVFAVFALTVETVETIETVRLRDGVVERLDDCVSDLAVLNVVDPSLVIDNCELGLGGETLEVGRNVAFFV
jgi:uncharacterized protein with GYD domain